jgi:hypothetical protein
LSADTSRGFELTSIKAAFVIERLNEVFGPCGIGWRYVHSPFEEVQTGNGRVEIVTEVAFQYRFHATNDCTGTDPVTWNAQTNDWAFRNGHSNQDWSHPIYSCGGKSLGKGGGVITDARKSAVTDGLTKAASMIGVGHEVFKGQVRVGRGSGQTPKQSGARNKGNGKQPVPADGNGQDSKKEAATDGNGKASATTFWTLYRNQGEQAGVSQEYAKRLANQGDWVAACTELQTLIAKAN